MADTLKSICEQCSHIQHPDLGFIPPELSRNGDIIRRDLAELTLAASVEAEKSVTILAGCTLEAILYTFIQAQTDFIAARRGAFQFNAEGGLDNFISIFNSWFRGVLPEAGIPDLVVGYRNLVHINREIGYPPDICSRASREMLGFLNNLLEQLSQFNP
jgi:hypothetical protein